MTRDLRAVPGTGQRALDEEVRERPRLLAAVGECQQPGCAAPTRTIDTLDGKVVFEVDPVPLTAELVAAGAAYVMVRCRGTVVVGRVRELTTELLAKTTTALTPHTHADELNST